MRTDGASSQGGFAHFPCVLLSNARTSDLHEEKFPAAGDFTGFSSLASGINSYPLGIQALCKGRSPFSATGTYMTSILENSAHVAISTLHPDQTAVGFVYKDSK
uniref:Uncharacterized protein n=1 Tax=Opuntia streptacantha TaxID=393608 RepID=A0A7C9AQX8_OPUST